MLLATLKPLPMGDGRTLYSLRHTYATLALVSGEVDIHTLSRQMHLDPFVYTTLLYHLPFADKPLGAQRSSKAAGKRTFQKSYGDLTSGVQSLKRGNDRKHFKGPDTRDY